ncbi:MAG: hypothetical protein PHO70_03775 [Candidatus Omnitrophica bacterium]|nr:hypothetical protein [Candidatus Omnitrophota bacterium]
MKKLTILLLLLLVVLNAPICAQSLDDSRMKTILGVVVDPKLLYPVNDEVDLTDKDFLEFHWAMYATDLVNRRHSVFRLYEGEDAKEINLIFQKRLPPNITKIKIDTALLDDAKTYTWSVEQFYLKDQGRGTASAFFKVTKKKIEKSSYEY